MRLGFIGAGNIGLPICGHLVAKGHDVRVFDRDPAAQARAVAAGAQAAESVIAAADAAEVVFTWGRFGALRAHQAAVRVLRHDDPPCRADR